MKLRSFLVLLFAAAVAPAADLGKRDDAASEKLGIKLSFQCWTYNKLSFFETVDEIAKLGIKYVEIYPGQKLKPGSDLKVGLDWSDETLAEVNKKLADAGGLKLVAFGVAGIPTDEKGARSTFAKAKRIGLEVLVTETKPNDVIEKLSQEFAIKVALHNHPKTWPPQEVLDACRDRAKTVGSCSDTGHWIRANLKPPEMFKVLEGRVLHSHFKDLDKFVSGHDVVWGTGVGDSKAMLAELKRQGYKGYLSVEYEYGDLKHLAENLPKCVQFFDATMAEIAK